jgi:L-amino acid N-acyltransferase YncA
MIWLFCSACTVTRRPAGNTAAKLQRQLMRYLFAHTPANRVEAGTEITNVGEQRALEKAGFTREGVLRGALFRDGQWHDCVFYGVLRDDVDLGTGSAPGATGRPSDT